MNQLDYAFEAARVLAALFDKHEPHNSQTYDSGCADLVGYDEVCDEAGRVGLVRLGAGNFSAVFTHRACPDYAIKLCFKAEDDSCAAYLAWARANPGIHVPRVYQLKKHGGCYTAVLDKLEPLDNEHSDDFKAVQQGLQYSNDTGAYCDTTAYQVAASIYKFFEGACSFDMHSGNAMRDKDGSIVITDPVSFSRTDKARELRTRIEHDLGLEDV
jgi:hypothetical protein